jgi:hypothetical protein
VAARRFHDDQLRAKEAAQRSLRDRHDRIHYERSIVIDKGRKLRSEEAEELAYRLGPESVARQTDHNAELRRRAFQHQTSQRKYLILNARQGHRRRPPRPQLDGRPSPRRTEDPG